MIPTPIVVQMGDTVVLGMHTVGVMVVLIFKRGQIMSMQQKHGGRGVMGRTRQVDVERLPRISKDRWRRATLTLSHHTAALPLAGVALAPSSVLVKSVKITDRDPVLHKALEFSIKSQQQNKFTFLMIRT